MLKPVEFEHVSAPEENEVNRLQNDDNQKISGSKLRNATPLKPFRINEPRIENIANQLFQEIISQRGRKFKSPAAAKQTIKIIIANLFLADFMGQSVRYSRDKNHYTRNKKFGRWNLSYALVISIVDTLEALGYTIQAPGRTFYEDKGKGTQARMWASQKLLALFHEQNIVEPDFITVAEQDPIQLTKKVRSGKSGTKKVHVPFAKTNHIRQIEDNVVSYNKAVKENRINVIINYNDIVNYKLLFNFIEQYYYNRISIISIMPSQYYYLLYYSHSTSIPSYHPIPSPRPTIPLPHITQSFSWKVNTDKVLDEACSFRYFVLQKRREYYQDLQFARIISDKNLKKAIENTIYDKANKEFELGNIGIDYLNISLNMEYLYRVFSRNSFDKGGRFYGAIYQSLPGHIRRNIYINDEPTVELDYKALHIRMLYHMKGIDFIENPYSACAGEEYKKLFKTAFLVSINAENERTAMQAISEQRKKRNLSLPAIGHSIKWMVQKIREAHPEISEYLFSDMGVVLQNKDSHIMNNILMRLLDQNILGLPIHDSIIVQERHEEALKAVMLYEYEKEMGFSTEVEKK